MNSARLPLSVLSCLSQATSDSVPQYVVEVLACLTRESAKSRKSSQIKPSSSFDKGEMQVS